MKLTNQISALKKAFIILGTGAAFVLGSSAVLQASSHNADSQRSGKMQQHLLQKLDLSEAQQTEVKAIRENYKPQMLALRDAHKALREQRKDLDPASSNYVSAVQTHTAEKARLMQEAETLKAQMKHEIALVLTEEQRAEMAELRAEQQAKRQERREKRADKRQRRRDENTQ